MIKENEIVKAADIIELFGLSDEEKIASLLYQLGTVNTPSIKSEDDEDDEDEDDETPNYLDWVLIRRKGIELGFSEYYYHSTGDFDLWGDGELLLTQAYFYNDRPDMNISKFQGLLPFELRFTDNRHQARLKMAKFEATRHSHLSDCWDLDNYRLTIQYSEKETIDSVICVQQPKPISCPEDFESFPSFEQLVSLFGSSPIEPSFKSVWNKGKGLSADNELTIKRFGQISLAKKLGLTLTFAGGGECPALLKSFTLHSNRDFDSAGWPGELPFGLCFDDSPETMKKKVGIKPIEEFDNLDMGECQWQLEHYLLHILYSNIDNRIRQIKVCQHEISS